MIPIYKPYLTNYKTSAMKAINDEWISNHGIYIKLASDKLCEILGNKYCVLMNNGTSATQCLYKALKFKYPNINKIYVPNNVFVAPWNCGVIEYNPECFTVTKLNHDTMNMDTSEEYIMSLDKNACVMIVHNLGNIINVSRLQKIRPDLIFIEDNCEGLFGKYENMFSGTVSLCSAVSFYGNKTITTGEGGAFLTNDYDVYNYIKTMYSHGMSEKRYVHNILGNNYRMTNIEAGFLYDQLNDYKHIIELKKNIFNNYDSMLNKLIKYNKIKLLVKEENTMNSNWMYTIILKCMSFDKLEKFMEYKNVQIRPFFYDIHVHNHLNNIKKCEEDEFTKEITNYGVMLPSYPELTLDEQKYIISCLEEFLL
jgi:perosamine synthetase